MVLVGDDKWPEYDRIWGLSSPAYRLADSALRWSARMGTDGWFPEGREHNLMPSYKPRYRDELVEAGVWEYIEGKGYRLTDFFPLNKSSAEIEAIRESRKKAGTVGGRERQRRRRESRKTSSGDPPNA